MEGFTAKGDQLKWETPHLELDSKGKFALSSLTFDVTGHTPIDIPIVVTTNLVENDFHNTDGIVAVLASKQQSYHATVLECWKLDSSRPRNVMFTLRASVSTLL